MKHINGLLKLWQGNKANYQAYQKNVKLILGSLEL